MYITRGKTVGVKNGTTLSHNKEIAHAVQKFVSDFIWEHGHDKPMTFTVEIAPREWQPGVGDYEIFNVAVTLKED
jgi:hypothetical protein